MLPTFFIVGAAKSGTTALAAFLDQHPDVYLSRPKEPAYFVPDDVRRHAGPGDAARVPYTATDGAAYRALFAGRSERALGEATTSYLALPGCAEAIRSRVPHARILAVLRDPVERAHSAFVHLRREGREPGDDLREAVRREPERVAAGYEPLWHYVGAGRYAEQLERYLAVFPAEQVHVLLHDDLLADPVATVRRCYAHLGVDDGFAPRTDERFNAGGAPRSRRVMRLLHEPPAPVRRVARRIVPSQRLRTRTFLSLYRANLAAPETLDAALRRELLPRFHDDLERLEVLLGRDLDAWRAPVPRAAGFDRRRARPPGLPG